MPPFVLQIALPRPLPQAFDYLPPGTERPGADWIGCRVRVPFGRGEAVGVVIGLGRAAVDASGLKPLLERLDANCHWTAEAWDTLEFCQRYYHAPFGEIWATSLPGPLRDGEPWPETRTRFWRLTAAGLSALPRLRAGRPRDLAMRLRLEPVAESLLEREFEAARITLRRLAERQYAELLYATAAPRPFDPGPVLNPDQQAAVAAITGAPEGFRPLLLEGVTGSGKTEVYLEAIRHTLERGRQALLLVPEIGLTAQTVARLQRGLPVEVHRLHSGLADGERVRAFAAMADGHGQVLVGTRSAIFVPLPKAGLIIVDEEHDSSYKQQDGIRYHARDLALWRGQRLAVPVLLGSATPSLETLRQVQAGRITPLALPLRAHPAARPPNVRILDLRKRPLLAGMAPELQAALRQVLDRGEQGLVFRNRRGWAPVLHCHDCGWSAPCRHCDARLTLYAGGRSLRCHHCGARAPLPLACPDCGGLALQAQGQGTEQIEDALQTLFPQAKVVRVDRDTTAVRDGLALRLAELGAGPGLLVGTQMLAKGHDLPRLTLSALLSLDEGLYSADFRAGERLGQLLIQVAGRAGRAATAGEVWLQTHHPEHPWLALLLEGGYRALAEVLLAERQAAALPPFVHWALLRAEARHEATALAFLEAAAGSLGSAQGLQLRGPQPAPMARRAGRARVQLLLEASQRPALQSALAAAVPGWYRLAQARRVRWSLDVDPIDLL